MNGNKIFGQVVLLLALSLCVYILASIGMTYRAKSAATLERTWRTDIDNLSFSNKLPPYWKEIRIVEKFAAVNDRLAESWIKNVYPPIEINPSGKYKLEILYLSEDENQTQKAIIQHHIIHIPTGNSIWEISRKYDLD